MICVLRTVDPAGSWNITFLGGEKKRARKNVCLEVSVKRQTDLVQEDGASSPREHYNVSLFCKTPKILVPHLSYKPRCRRCHTPVFLEKQEIDFFNYVILLCVCFFPPALKLRARRLLPSTHPPRVKGAKTLYIYISYQSPIGNIHIHKYQ